MPQKRLKNTDLGPTVVKNWSSKWSYQSIRWQGSASRSPSSETRPAGPAGHLTPREWRWPQAEPLRQLHKEETLVKTHGRLPQWDFTEAQKGEMRLRDAHRWIVVAVGEVESRWWQNLGMVICGSFGLTRLWRRMRDPPLPPPPRPKPLAVWVFTADKSDKLWLADLSVACCFCVCQFGWLLHQAHMIPGRRSNRGLFQWEGKSVGLKKKEK